MTVCQYIETVIMGLRKAFRLSKRLRLGANRACFKVVMTSDVHTAIIHID